MRLFSSICQVVIMNLLVLCMFGCVHIRCCPSDFPRPDSALLFPWSCPAYAGGDGTSLDQAVILTGISVQFMARKAKEDWINRYYPGGVTYEVRMKIVQDRVVQIISVQLPSGDLAQVFFDVTGTVTCPGVGAWFFVGSDGVEGAGMIEEQYLRTTDPHPWQQLVGTRSGELIYQLDDEIGNGLLASGKLKDGKQHGAWCYDRAIEGSMCVEYDMGTEAGRRLICRPLPVPCARDR